MYYNNDSYINFLIQKLPSKKIYKVHDFPLCINSNHCTHSHLSTLPGFISPNCSSKITKILNHIKLNDSILTGFIQSRKANPHLLENHSYKRQNIAILETESDPNKFLSRCRRSTRNRLRNAMNDKYYVTDSFSNQFVKYYEILCNEKNFKTIYSYTKRDFQKLNFDTNLIPISIYNDKGEFVGGSIVGRYNDDNFDYILSCYDEKIKNAGRIVIFESQKYVNAIGGKYLNLGGGTTENDSLFDFKLSFGAFIQPIFYFKIVNCFSKFEEYFKISFQNALKLSFYPPIL
jgi:hypothetical protein